MTGNRKTAMRFMRNQILSFFLLSFVLFGYLPPGKPPLFRSIRLSNLSDFYSGENKHSQDFDKSHVLYNYFMGYDSTSYVADISGNKLSKLQEFFELLGYTSFTKKNYAFYKDDYKHVTGMTATLELKQKTLEVYIHRTIWGSFADVEVHNKTLRLLKNYFGGYFITDYGRNRYFPRPKTKFSPLEIAYCRAHQNFEYGINKINLYRENVEFNKHFSSNSSKKAYTLTNMLDMHPAIFINQLFAVYLVCCLEEYFKSIFAGYIDIQKSEKLLADIRPQNIDFVALLSGDGSFGKIIADSTSFQNIDNIIKQFNRADTILNLKAEFDRPYGKAGKPLKDLIQKLINRRHNFVHRNQTDCSYTDKELCQDIDIVSELVRRLYAKFSKVYGWTVSNHLNCFCIHTSLK